MAGKVGSWVKRQEFREEASGRWDVIVVGGGMTGAGVFREVARAGYRVLLVEQRDFAWGTSSRSGKLVHGGLRYLAQGQIRTTWHSVREREKLLQMYSGLVENLTFVAPVYDLFSGILLRAGLSVYDTMACRRTRQYHKAERLSALVPDIDRTDLRGGFTFEDAQTDDARLVYRVIREGEKAGGTAVNYIRVEELVRDGRGRVLGLTAMDAESGRTLELQARAVVNATGVWADNLRGQLGEKPRLRRLRGSHLILPRQRLPLDQALSFRHPQDHRPLYAMPWLGVTLVGTTDLDHEFSLSDEPRISREEGRYLLEGLNRCFPAARLTAGDVSATFAGVRPVLNTGKSDPSKEARDYAIWSQEGLVTVTGGKLTTFALLAKGAMREIAQWAGSPKAFLSGREAASGAQRTSGESSAENSENTKNTKNTKNNRKIPATAFLARRYGDDAPAVWQRAQEDGGERIPGTDYLWAEVLWSAESEQVIHLEDLMLRRTRWGLLLPAGGRNILPQLRERLSQALGWDVRRWEEEEVRYLSLWNAAYNPSLLG